MTGPLDGSKPSTKACRAALCGYLLPHQTETVREPRTTWYCDKAKKIPGNLSRCPLAAGSPVTAPVVKTWKVLAVRQPWATLYVEGKKTLDIRSRNCHYRGPVAIYATRGHVRRKDRTYFKSILGRDVDDLSHGYIVATAEITDTIRFDTPEEFADHSTEHLCTPFFFEPGCYGWRLENIEPLSNHIGFKMPKGCVNWSKINNSVIENFRAMPAAEAVMV